MQYLSGVEPRQVGTVKINSTLTLRMQRISSEINPACDGPCSPPRGGIVKLSMHEALRLEGNARDTAHCAEAGAEISSPPVVEPEK